MFGEQTLALGLGCVQPTLPERTRHLTKISAVRQKSFDLSLQNARRYSVTVELRAMLDVSSFLQSWLVPMLCIVAGTISIRLDASNSRAVRPISAAPSDYHNA